MQLSLAYNSASQPYDVGCLPYACTVFSIQFHFPVDVPVFSCPQLLNTHALLLLLLLFAQGCQGSTLDQTCPTSTPCPPEELAISRHRSAGESQTEGKGKKKKKKKTQFLTNSHAKSNLVNRQRLLPLHVGCAAFTAPLPLPGHYIKQPMRNHMDPQLHRKTPCKHFSV